MTTYAADTKVPVEKSRAEIERTLQRYGATAFMYGWQGDSAVIAFVVNDRHVRFILPLPSEVDFSLTATRQRRSPSAAKEAHGKAIRQRWRALALVVKAKLEAVESGIVTFDDEFSMHYVLPDGRTVREHVLPAIQEAYDTGQVPELLPPTRRALE